MLSPCEHTFVYKLVVRDWGTTTSSVMPQLSVCSPLTRYIDIPQSFFLSPCSFCPLHSMDWEMCWNGLATVSIVTIETLIQGGVRKKIKEQGLWKHSGGHLTPSPSCDLLIWHVTFYLPNLDCLYCCYPWFAKQAHFTLPAHSLNHAKTILGNGVYAPSGTVNLMWENCAIAVKHVFLDRNQA